jgi:hypothetical protein
VKAERKERRDERKTGYGEKMEGRKEGVTKERNGKKEGRKEGMGPRP